ncbi:hypothetical protein [Alicyclobacillus sp. ALC3]|uniref:hypothetical protein n=1 Tax=Alicyclobacillus sp. ALC3 TaxID=2796143 RepID=UPI0023791F73|nr:hypothetical protein [Alicyclobacillus sp. ALC3]WDL95169.1 hypothetical protein JC200_12110 [Alicyclobacillus sp. ALC3]
MFRMYSYVFAAPASDVRTPAFRTAASGLSRCVAVSGAVSSAVSGAVSGAVSSAVSSAVSGVANKKYLIAPKVT